MEKVGISVLSSHTVHRAYILSAPIFDWYQYTVWDNHMQCMLWGASGRQKVVTWEPLSNCSSFNWLVYTTSYMDAACLANTPAFIQSIRKGFKIGPPHDLLSIWYPWHHCIWWNHRGSLCLYLETRSTQILQTGTRLHSAHLWCTVSLHPFSTQGNPHI